MLDYPEPVLSRDRSTDASKTPAVPAEPLSGPSKGRPTPTRKEAEAARRKPIVPADRKAAARAQRSSAKEARDREYQAMQSGDERFLPARDKGPVRRWVRDYVDARRNLGEYFLPASLLMVVAISLTGQNITAFLIVTAVLYLVVLATFADGFLLYRRLKKGLAARFGESAVPRGTVMYGVTRAFQLRRFRLPRPQVKRGERPA